MFGISGHGILAAARAKAHLVDTAGENAAAKALQQSKRPAPPEVKDGVDEQGANVAPKGPDTTKAPAPAEKIKLTEGEKKVIGMRSSQLKQAYETHKSDPHKGNAEAAKILRDTFDGKGYDKIQKQMMKDLNALAAQGKWDWVALMRDANPTTRAALAGDIWRQLPDEVKPQILALMAQSGTDAEKLEIGHILATSTGRDLEAYVAALDGAGMSLPQMLNAMGPEATNATVPALEEAYVAQNPAVKYMLDAYDHDPQFRRVCDEHHVGRGDLLRMAAGDNSQAIHDFFAKDANTSKDPAVIRAGAIMLTAELAGEKMLQQAWTDAGKADPARADEYAKRAAKHDDAVKGDSRYTPAWIERAGGEDKVFTPLEMDRDATKPAALAPRGLDAIAQRKLPISGYVNVGGKDVVVDLDADKASKLAAQKGEAAQVQWLEKNVFGSVADPKQRKAAAETLLKALTSQDLSQVPVDGGAISVAIGITRNGSDGGASFQAAMPG